MEAGADDVQQTAAQGVMLHAKFGARKKDVLCTFDAWMSQC